MVLGGPGLTSPLAVAGFEMVPPAAGTTADTVLAGWFPEFTMPALEAACHALWDGATLYSASQTPLFAVEAAGDSARCGRWASRRRTRCAAADRLGARPARLAVGDDPQLKVPMAHRGRSLAIAVQTGWGPRPPYDALPASRRPHLCVRGVDELFEMLGEALMEAERARILAIFEY